jgi:putative cell wall-binding protein
MRRGAALASQSLSIMIALVPYVREMFRRHLSQKQAVMLVEFDKLKRVRRPAIHHAPSATESEPRTIKSTRTRFTPSSSRSWVTG